MQKITKQQKIINKAVKDPKVRRNLTRQSHFWFFHIYMNHYVKYPTADFQREMFKMTEDKSIQNLVIVAFRGSAKSTIMNLSYPIWSILGEQQKKFILILGQTQQQAKQHLCNLKSELENNKLLRADLGPFEERDEEWSAGSIVLSKYNARITSASIEQSVRGIRHGQHRPDLIICDDIEDLASVRTRDSRDKTHDWLTGEVIPAGDRNTRLVVIGNYLHDDSLIMRLRKSIDNKNMDGIFRAYPLIDPNNKKCLWRGKYPSDQEIKNEKQKLGSITAWSREYLLKIIANEDRLVQTGWIQYYDKLPTDNKEFRFTYTGVDLAISKKETADYTAMVSARVYGEGKNMHVYILPHPINKRLSSLETQNEIKNLSKRLGDGKYTNVYIEDVGYQKSVVEQLKADNIPAHSSPVNGQDKRARLSTVVHLIESGKVLFPKQGCEDLIDQLVNFGVEKHDDLADAFAIVLKQIIETKTAKFGIWFIDVSGPRGIDRLSDIQF